MKKEISVCDCCGKIADDESQLRKEEWLYLSKDSSINVLLNKPREEGNGFLLVIGFSDREYNFCSIGCLVKLLKGKKSI